jgi:hypothetical protein
MKMIASVIGCIALATTIAHAQPAQVEVYQGIATTTVAVLDPLSGQPRKQDTFQHNVQVLVGPPASAGGQDENNLFNLIVAPPPGESQVAEGQFGIVSALPATVPLEAGPAPFLFRYWELQAAGGRVTGTLVQDHAEEAAALNLLNSVDINLLLVNIPIVMPLAMVEGTRLQGTIDGTQALLRIEGNTVDLAHPFVADIAATRVN